MVESGPALLQIAAVPSARGAGDHGGRVGAPGPRRAAAHRARPSQVAGETIVVVANLDGTLVAYLDRCPACLAALSEGRARRRRPDLRRRATPTTYGWPGAPSAGDGELPWPRCRCCPSMGRGRCRCPARWCSAVSGLGSCAGSAHRRSRSRRPSRRSAASSARSTSASGTGTSPTSTSTGCCACAGPATCCSRRRAPAAAATGASARTVRRVDGPGARRGALGRAADPGGPGVLLPSRPGRRAACSRSTPGPGGATESLLDLAAWADVAASQPGRWARLPSDVEAVLLRRHDGGFSCHLVPIDVCYELVGHRPARHWTGLGGGAGGLARIDGVLRRRSTSAPCPCARDGAP